MKLTEEQQKLVADNHNLIYGYLTSHGLDVEEWYDILAIQLCITATVYDKSKGAFSTCFYGRAKWAIQQEYRNSMSMKRKHDLDINPLEDIPESKRVNMESEYDVLELEDWIERSDSEILRLKAQGYNQTEIAKMIGTAPWNVSRELLRLRKEYYEHYR